MFHKENVRSQQLGYLGLIAATIRALGLIERIDARLDLDPKKGTSKARGFILANNQCDSSLLNNHALLQQYKEQSCVESSFKFMKNSAFELDAFFIKTPERITALMMVITLCLMVYNFAQAHMRQCLKEQDETLPNQLGKSVQNLTMKWIAELMNMIAVVAIVTNNQKYRVVTHVKPVHQQIISYFGPYALEIYGLSTGLARASGFSSGAIEQDNYKNRLSWREM